MYVADKRGPIKPQSVTDRCCEMSKRIQNRKECAENAEFGFDLPVFCTKCTNVSVIPIQEIAL
jgi:hypothetical protein